MSIAAFISGEVGPGVTIPLFITRGLGIGAQAEAPAVQPTGGWLRYVERGKAEEEKRRERVRMGIIPEEMPEETAEAIIEAAEAPARQIAERRLEEKIESLTQEREAQEELRGTLRSLLDAYERERQAHIEDYLQQMEAQREALNAELLTELQQRQNAQAVLAMLALID